MIYFGESAPMVDLNEAAYTEQTFLDTSSHSSTNENKKSKCANYSEFFEKCQNKKSSINSKLERLNAYFKDKYPDFYGISFVECNEDN